MGIVIDTSAIIELERSRVSWEAVLEKAEDDLVFLPAIVWGELMAGVHLAASVPRALKRKEKLNDLRRAVPILPFTARVAERWAELFAALQRSGTPVPANDLCVAATAIADEHTILVSSKDEAHFRRIPRATVLTL